MYKITRIGKDLEEQDLVLGLFLKFATEKAKLLSSRHRLFVYVVRDNVGRSVIEFQAGARVLARVTGEN